MSTALAKTKTPKIEVIDVSSIAQEESSLQLACMGQLQVSDIDTAYLATDDSDDLEGIRNLVPRLQANGQAGCFHAPGTPKEELRRCPDVIDGTILSRAAGAVHYVPTDPKKIENARSFGYNELLDAPKWICRNPNVGGVDSKAIINPQLSTKQRQEATELRIGGATNKGCLGCSAGCWHTIIDASGNSVQVRMCTATEALIWMDSKDPEPRVLQISAGSSVSAIKKFFAQKFKRMGRALHLFTYLVRLSFSSQTMNGKDVFVINAEIIGALPPEMMPVLSNVRKDCAWMLQRASEESVEHDEQPSDESAATTPGSDQQTAAEIVGGLL